MELIYKKIEEKDREQLFNLIDISGMIRQMRNFIKVFKNEHFIILTYFVI